MTKGTKEWFNECSLNEGKKEVLNKEKKDNLNEWCLECLNERIKEIRKQGLNACMKKKRMDE